MKLSHIDEYPLNKCINLCYRYEYQTYSYMHIHLNSIVLLIVMHRAVLKNRQTIDKYIDPLIKY